MRNRHGLHRPDRGCLVCHAYARACVGGPSAYGTGAPYDPGYRAVARRLRAIHDTTYGWGTPAYMTGGMTA